MWKLFTLLLCVLAAGPVAAFTITFEEAEFTAGEAPPATFSTPWGDVRFGGPGLRIVEDPFEAGGLMLSPEDIGRSSNSSDLFSIGLPPGIFEPEFLMVNPAGEQMVISYFDAGWDDCQGSPCYESFGDDGVTVAPESRRILVLTGHDARFGSAGPEFYRGAHPDFDYSRDCDGTPEGCFYGWGIASISWTPEPGTGLLVGLGLVGLGAKRRVRR